MSYNKSIVPGILIEFRGSLGYFGNYYDNSLSNKDHFYILTETKIIECHDMLIFYGLTEERFFPVYRWHFDESIGNGAANIVV